jgi:hypothetical protein
MCRDAPNCPVAPTRLHWDCGCALQREQSVMDPFVPPSRPFALPPSLLSQRCLRGRCAAQPPRCAPAEACRCLGRSRAIRWRWLSRSCRVAPLCSAPQAARLSTRQLASAADGGDCDGRADFGG